jgi:hypothetical protein
MLLVYGARMKRSSGAAVARVALQRRAAARRDAGAVGNQAALQRFRLLQRQTADDDQKKPDPKPLLPIGPDWKFDPSVSQSDAPTPWDKPGGGSGPTGVSLEDINKGRSILFGGKGAPPTLNKDFQMPPCSLLETPDSTPAARKYKTFEQYDTERKVFHSPLSKDPWPPLTPQQYQAAINDCKAQAPQPPAPKGDSPQSILPPSQAYAQGPRASGKYQATSR